MFGLLIIFALGVAIATAVPRRPEIPDEPKPDEEKSPYSFVTLGYVPPSVLEPDEPPRQPGTPTGQTVDGRPALDPGRTVAGKKTPLRLTRQGSGVVDVVPGHPGSGRAPEDTVDVRLAELPSKPARVRVYVCVTVERAIGPQHQATLPGAGVPCWRWRVGSRAVTAIPVAMEKRNGEWIFAGRVQYLAEAMWDGRGSLRPVQWWNDLGGAWTPDDREMCSKVPRFEAGEIWYLDQDIPPKDQRDYVDTRREWKLARIAPTLELEVVRGEPGPGHSDRFLHLRVRCPELPIYLRGGPCEHPELAGADWPFSWRARLEVER